MESALAELDCHGWVVWRSFLNSVSAGMMPRTGSKAEVRMRMEDSFRNRSFPLRANVSVARLLLDELG